MYLDASVSMRGFVQQPADAGSYPEVLEDLLGRLASSGYTYRVHPFCEDPCAQRETEALHDPRRIYSPAFYSGRESPLAQLLHRLAQAPARGAHIIVSDMEQSATHTDQQALVAAFRALSERAPELLLLCFQADFLSGAALRKGRRTGPRKTAAPLRRYYMLIIAPSAAALGELQQLVLRHLPTAGTLQPALPPMVVSDLHQEIRGEEPAWGTYRQVQTLSCAAGPAGEPAGGPAATFASFVERRPQRGAQDALSLRLSGALQAPDDHRGAPRFATGALADLRYEVRRATLAGGRLTAAAPAPWHPGAARHPSAADALLLTVPAPRPEQASWDFYRVRVRAGGGNLEVPDWVRQATGALAQGQTPHLDHLVRAMLQAVTEDVVFLDLFLAFGRGE